jgi:peroxiredoxin
MLAEGAIAPDFALGEFRLADALKKGPVLLAFFKISCPTCQMAFPFLQRLADGMPPGLQIVAVSQDDRTGTDQFLRHFRISLPTILDPAPLYLASNLFGIRNVPALFLIEPDGAISRAVAGFSKAYLDELSDRFDVPVFRAGENVPSFRPG